MHYALITVSPSPADRGPDIIDAYTAHNKAKLYYLHDYAEKVLELNLRVRNRKNGTSLTLLKQPPTLCSSEQTFNNVKIVCPKRDGLNHLVRSAMFDVRCSKDNFDARCSNVDKLRSHVRASHIAPRASLKVFHSKYWSDDLTYYTHAFGNEGEIILPFEFLSTAGMEECLTR